MGTGSQEGSSSVAGADRKSSIEHSSMTGTLRSPAARMSEWPVASPSGDSGWSHRGQRDARLIADSVRKLITQRIDSIEQLEVLLLMREHRERGWTVEAISDHLRSSVMSVGGRLKLLVQHGLIDHSNGSYRYAAAGEIDDTVGQLAQAYVEHRFSVIELIFDKPSDKLRVFADAFRVGSNRSRRKGKDGKTDG